MKIKVSEIPEEGCWLEIHEAVEIEHEPSGRIPVDASLHLRREGYAVFINGDMQARVGLNCSRCLEPFEDSLSAEVHLTLLPGDYGVMLEESRELSPDEMNTAFYEGEELDIGCTLAEHVALSIPLKPLCRAGCNGICSVCGADRNTDPCDCMQEEIDERLLKLREILERKE